jgi:hypothetical protein
MTMSKRTDIHRPSAINPEEYAFIGIRVHPRLGEELEVAAA